MKSILLAAVSLVIAITQDGSIALPDAFQDYSTPGIRVYTVMIESASMVSGGIRFSGRVVEVHRSPSIPTDLTYESPFPVRPGRKHLVIAQNCISGEQGGEACRTDSSYRMVYELTGAGNVRLQDPATDLSLAAKTIVDEIQNCVEDDCFPAAVDVAYPIEEVLNALKARD